MEHNEQSKQNPSLFSDLFITFQGRLFYTDGKNYVEILGAGFGFITGLTFLGKESDRWMEFFEN